MNDEPTFPAGLLESPERPQAVVRIVPGGGTKTAKQIFDQWMYLSRKGDMPLRRSERHLAIMLKTVQLRETADSWVQEAGYCLAKHDMVDGVQSLTTHIVVSFPIGTDVEASFAAGRAWAEEMFGSGHNGGTFDYVTACHDDRPHPHVHLVVNRRALEGHWLKISRRNPKLSYDTLRLALVDIAKDHGIVLEATSRADRGISDRPITFAEYRRRIRRTTAAAEAMPVQP